MQVKRLKSILETDYIICKHGNELFIGSAYIPDIIIVSQDLEISFGKTVEWVTKPDGSRIWRFSWDKEINAKLHAMLERLEKFITESPKAMKEIMTQKDALENPIKVYRFDGETIVESFTDNPSYPNTDEDGNLLYENITFTDRLSAIEYALKNAEIGLKWSFESREKGQKQVAEAEQDIKDYEELIQFYRAELKALQPTFENNPTKCMGESP